MQRRKPVADHALLPQGCEKVTASAQLRKLELLSTSILTSHQPLMGNSSAMLSGKLAAAQ